MDFAAVYHKTSEQMSYPLDEDRLVVNLKTGYDVKRVFIIHGDPFDAGILGGNEKWHGKREEIVYRKHLPCQVWWTTTLTPPYKRCKYYFELQTDSEVWYYFEDGFLTKEQMDMPGRLLQYFIVPWMNPADVNRTPEWVNDTVWYQIFPDRFCNGTPESIRSATRALLEECTVHPNFVISSGCDIPPASRWDNIDAFFNEVETFYQNA